MAIFPLQNQPLVLPSGRIVRIYNLSFLTQESDPAPVLRIEPSFRIQYATAIGPGQEPERSAEAAEVIAYFLGETAAEHTTVAYADICSTPAQAERRETPQASFKFSRAAQGEWGLVDNDRVLDVSNP